MINKTIQSLWIHVACYFPMITFCVWAYFEPLNMQASPQQIDCYQDYKLFLLVCAICMVPAVLFILYIVKCYRRYSPDQIEKFAAVSLGLECLIFSALFVYNETLQSKEEETCAGTGTSLGSVVMVPINICSATCALFSALILGAYLIHLLQLCLRHICCCSRGATLIGSHHHLAKIPYNERHFTPWSDDYSCAICLNDF